MIINYKGFKLESESEQKLDTKKWTTAIKIIIDKGSHVITKNYNTVDEHDTKEEADKYSIKFGQQIIDGVYKEFSIT